MTRSYRNGLAAISTLLILSGIIGFEVNGLAAQTASLFALGVGILGAKHAVAP